MSKFVEKPMVGYFETEEHAEIKRSLSALGSRLEKIEELLLRIEARNLVVETELDARLKDVVCRVEESRDDVWEVYERLIQRPSRWGWLKFWRKP